MVSPNHVDAEPKKLWSVGIGRLCMPLYVNTDGTDSHQFTTSGYHKYGISEQHEDGKIGVDLRDPGTTGFTAILHSSSSGNSSGRGKPVILSWIVPPSTLQLMGLRVVNIARSCDTPTSREITYCVALFHADSCSQALMKTVEEATGVTAQQFFSAWTNLRSTDKYSWDALLCQEAWRLGPIDHPKLPLLLSPQQEEHVNSEQRRPLANHVFRMIEEQCNWSQVILPDMQNQNPEFLRGKDMARTKSSRNAYGPTSPTSLGPSGRIHEHSPLPGIWVMIQWKARMVEELGAIHDKSLVAETELRDSLSFSKFLFTKYWVSEEAGTTGEVEFEAKAGFLQRSLRSDSLADDFKIHSVPQDTANSTSNAEKRHQECLNEVLYRERDCVRDMEYLRDSWIKPLRSGNIILEEQSEDCDTQVFRNVLEIYSVNVRLADMLSKRQRRNVVKLVREFLAKVNVETGKSENRFNLAQLDHQLVFKNGEAEDLRLRDEDREMIYKGPLKKRGGTQSESAELTVYLFDHAILMVKQKRKNEQSNVYPKPVPLELLVVAPLEESVASRGGAVRPRSLISRGSNPKYPASPPPGVDKHSKNGFAITFIHLGRRGYQITLWDRSLVFETRALSAGYFVGTNRVTCAAPFDNGNRMVYGTDNGAYLSDLRDNAKVPVKVISVPNVTQLDVLEEQGILIVVVGGGFD
ncbi:hypothetical protein P7C70_g7416, partial [Phenoliferia sp. Uapishka_3]